MSLWNRWFGGGTTTKSSAAAPTGASVGVGRANLGGETHRATPGIPSAPPASPNGAESAGAGKKVSYDPKLIAQLKRDHVELLSIFKQISSSHQLRAYDQVAKHLHAFKLALQGHVLSENVRFYAYLQGNLLKESEDAALMHEFRREMNTIVRGVTDFLKAYAGEGSLTRDNHSEFASQLNQVGTALQQRIDREESNLYPLYQG